MPGGFGGSPFGGGFDFMFTLVPIIIVIGFVVVIGGIALNGARYMKNASSPKESVYARVIAKRMDVRTHTHHHPHGAGDHMHTSRSSRTHYFITLEFEDGERREYLDVKGLYGLVVEGDEGYAAVQGDWIVAFERGAAK
ncbi:DUF2500 domain-containing protein [Paenibacillus antri]|uniref:DUF2500 domain-containing protein n=1 Tax=Paenibacillus antri TaxID=2582848 RepID=A0A5R9GFT4_9BACL|nr:DUF2500 domain-containing protein [Paenibacillus antri]TLS51553.1 DUF2500 domain-containing protein [Paenibacillus antri]